MEDDPTRNLNTWNFMENYIFYNPSTSTEKQVFPTAGNRDDDTRASYKIFLFYDFTKQTMYTARLNSINNVFIQGTPQEITFENNHIRLFGNIGWFSTTDITSEFSASLQITFHNDFKTDLRVKKWLQNIILTH